MFKIPFTILKLLISKEFEEIKKVDVLSDQLSKSGLDKVLTGPTVLIGFSSSTVLNEAFNMRKLLITLQIKLACPSVKSETDKLENDFHSSDELFTRLVDFLTGQKASVSLIDDTVAKNSDVDLVIMPNLKFKGNFHDTSIPGFTVNTATFELTFNHYKKIFDKIKISGNVQIG